MGACIARRDDRVAGILCSLDRERDFPRDIISMVRLGFRSYSRRRASIVLVSRQIDDVRRGNHFAIVRSVCSGSLFHLPAPIVRHSILRVLFFRAVSANWRLHG